MPVAVVACGPDVVYPRRHRGLHERVCESGLVLSELPPGTEPYRWSFPARNRIMAGLARPTLVVEAADPSGSLITADFAKDLGRCVAAVPGRVTSNVAQGTNSLLKEGAAAITGTDDVLDELFGVGVRHAPRPRAACTAPDDPLLRAVLDAADRCSSVEAIANTTGRSAAQTAPRSAAWRPTATWCGETWAAGSGRRAEASIEPAAAQLGRCRSFHDIAE